MKELLLSSSCVCTTSTSCLHSSVTKYVIPWGHISADFVFYLVCLKTQELKQLCQNVPSLVRMKRTLL